MAPRSEDPKLVIRVVSFELTQHIRPRYINVTDKQTDGRLAIAIPRFALRASRGNKTLNVLQMFYFARNLGLIQWKTSHR